MPISAQRAEQTRRSDHINDAAAQRAMARRRRRLWVNVAVFVLATVLMAYLLVAERDSQAERGAIRACRARLEYTRERLEALHARGIVAPLRLPLPDVPERAAPLDEREDPYLDVRARYLYNANYARDIRHRALVGVCCDAEPHVLFLREDGRHVVLFDGDTYTVQWLPESEFRRRAADLGFELPPQP